MICLFVFLSLFNFSGVGIQTKGWINSSFEFDEKVTIIFYTQKFERKTLEVLSDQAKKTNNKIVLLTPDDKEKSQKFVKENKITQSVGFGLRDFRKFKIKRLPQVMVFQSKDNTLINEDGNHVSIDFVPEYSNAELIRLAKAITSGTLDERVKSLGEFTKVANPDEVVELCNFLLQSDPPDEMNNHFIKRSMWYSRVAQLIKDAQEPGLSRRSSAEMSEINHDGLVDENLKVYKQLAMAKTIPQLKEDYFSRIDSTEPLSMLTRIAIIEEFENRAIAGSQKEARDFLLKACEKETDPYIQWHTLGALGYITKPDDNESGLLVTEISRLLDKENEKNYAGVGGCYERVKITMQELVYYLQN